MSDLSSKCKHELLVQNLSILENFKKKSYQILMNFKPQTLLHFLIQILSRILKSSNKENCSLFDSIQIHILFKNFGAREVHLLIKSIQTRLKII
jgi:hypothetical protein